VRSRFGPVQNCTGSIHRHQRRVQRAAKGNHTTASKSGVKFHHLDADGVKDAGEPGLAGWVIYVNYDDDGVADAGEPSATTGADGSYSITGVNPGTRKVKEVAQAGWTCSFPSPNCYHEETFTSGGALTNNDFGNWTTASKSGVKFTIWMPMGSRTRVSPGWPAGPSTSITTTTGCSTRASRRP